MFSRAAPADELTLILDYQAPAACPSAASLRQAIARLVTQPMTQPFSVRVLIEQGSSQDVFVVIHRRHAALRSEAVARSWVYGIVVRVARDYRRSQRRKALTGDDPDAVVDAAALSAHDQLEQREAVALLDRLLDSLPDVEREVLVLVELEQMSVPEIAELVGANVNTVYTRLRTARRDFEHALGRHRARERREP